MRFVLPLFLLISLLLSACGGSSADGPTDTYSSGRIRIAVDHSLQPVMQSQLAVFHDMFPKAHIDVSYVSEAEAVAMLGQDSVRLIVIPRKVTEAETAPLRALNIKPRSVLIALDGVALVVHPSVADTCLSVAALQQIVRGDAQTWGKAFGSKRSDSLRIVVDDAGSSSIRYLLDSIATRNGQPAVQKLPPNVFAAGSNQAVIDYVATHPNAMGIVGLAWLSDDNDSTQQVFLSKVRLVRVRENAAPAVDAAGKPDLSTDAGCYKPYQVHLLRKQYPLTRRVYIHSREARAGLGTAFTGFVTGDSGGRIFVKAELLPANSYIRTVELKTGQQP